MKRALLFLVISLLFGATIALDSPFAERLMKGRGWEVDDGWTVRFGLISKWKKTNKEAERFFTGLLFETFLGKFDPPYYGPGLSLAFSNLTENYLKFKKQTVKPSSYRNIKNHMTRAADAWGTASIKSIKYGEIEDFLYSQEQVCDKTRSDIRCVIHAFFAWCYDREYLDRMPKFPKVNFQLGFRNTVDLETQAAIINEVQRISAHISPWGSSGLQPISGRPAEMWSLTEGQIDHNLWEIITNSPVVMIS